MVIASLFIFVLPILTAVLYWYVLRMLLSNISSLPHGMLDIMMMFNPPVTQPPLIYATVSGINSHLEVNGDIAIVLWSFSNSNPFLNSFQICCVLFYCCLSFSYLVPFLFQSYLVTFLLTSPGLTEKQSSRATLRWTISLSVCLPPASLLPGWIRWDIVLISAWAPLLSV